MEPGIDDNGWIRVDAWLPEVNRRPRHGYEGLSAEVLVWDVDSGPDIAARDTLEGGWYSIQRRAYLNDSAITHWHELPKPPASATK